MTKQPLKNQYRSFLLRCVWFTEADEGEGETAVWRFTIRDVSAQPQEHRFNKIHELTAFLTAELNKNNPAS